MREGWKEVVLGEVVEVLSSKRIFASDYVSHGVPFLRSKDVIEKAIGTHDGEYLYITPERYNAIKQKFGAPIFGDLLLSAVGNRSGLAYSVKEDFEFYFKDGNVIWFRNFSDQLNSQFLEYLLNSRTGQFKLSNRMIGSAQKALTIVGVKTIELLLPPTEVQLRIVSIISRMNEKISLLKEQNRTLESLAQTLFKSWFVDFDPVIDRMLLAGKALPEALRARGERRRAVLESGAYPRLPEEVMGLFPEGVVFSEELGRWVPEGWEVPQLGYHCNVTDFVSNGSFAAIKANVTILEEKNYALYVRTTDFKNDFNSLKARYVDRSSYDFLKKSKLFGHEVIISNVGDTGTVFRPPVWMNYPMTLGSNAIMITNNETADYLFYYFKSSFGQAQIQGIVGGSAQPKFNKTDFRSLEVLMPRQNILDKFASSVADLRNRISSGKKQILTLTTLRDTLLPKLISGELPV